MTNTEMLNDIIKASGLTKGYIAEQLGLSTYSFQMKRENKRQFNAEEIKILCTVLHITSLREKENIFFSN